MYIFSNIEKHNYSNYIEYISSPISEIYIFYIDAIGTKYGWYGLLNVYPYFTKFHSIFAKSKNVLSKNQALIYFNIRPPLFLLFPAGLLISAREK